MPQHFNFEDTVKNLGESVVSFDNYQDEAMILHFKQSPSIRDTYTPINPMRFNALIIIGINEGGMEMKIDYNTYKATKNSIFLIMPTHITQIIGATKDIKGWCLVVSKSILDKLFSGNLEAPALISYIQLKKNPMTLFDAVEFNFICNSLDFISQKIKQQSHIFYPSIVLLALRMFFLDVRNVYLGKRENVIMPTLNRKEELFVSFRSLLRKCCKDQHEVTFYADKLCITTQYLSLILKEQSGKTASQWIQEALMTEAKILLKMPRTSVQQVADELHFPDQSTFGKFFKKHEKVSPMAFRKLMN